MLYTNHYIETPESHMELRWHTIHWPMVLGFATIMFAVVIGLAIGGVFCIIKSNILLGICCCCVALLFSIPSLQIPRAIIAHLRIPKKYGKANMEFGQDAVAVYVKDKTITRSYGEMKQLKETKNFFVIVFENTDKDRSYLPVKKSGLNCEPEEFREFVKKKIATAR